VLADQREDAVALLRAAGWRVAVAGAGRSVADTWAELGGPTGRSSVSGLSPVAAGPPGAPA
jgi:hypothetical protein